MALFKRILFYAFIILALGGAAWGYFFLRESKKPSLKAADVLPADAVCVFRSNNFGELAGKLLNQSLVWKEAININEFKSVHISILFFDSLIRENENLRDFFSERELYLGLYNKPAAASPLIIFNLDDLAQEKDFADALTKLSKYVVKAEDHYVFSGPVRKWFVKVQQGVVAMSDAFELINETFSDTSQKLKSNKAWTEFSQLQEDNDLLSVFVDHTLLKSLEKRSQFNLSKAILSGYSLADLSLSPDGFSINGFNQPDSISVLNTLSSQKAQPCDFLSVLPFNTIAFKAFGFHDFNGWRSKLKTRPSSFWKSVNDSAMFNAEKEFYANINSKIIELSMKYQGIQCKALVVEVKDTAKAAELLTYLSDSIVVLQGMKTGILKKDSSDLIKTCFGNAFDVKGDVGFVYGSYLFFCEQALSGYYVSSLINSSSILQNKIFGAYAKENLGLNFNYIFYSALNKDHERPVEVFSFLKQDDLKHFDKFTDFSISLSNYKNMLQFRINLKYQQEPENKEVPGLWTFEADTVIDRCAAIFKNHKTGENEIAFCDGKNNFYLLNATGNMLWKTPLAEPVISDIYTVDAFKNNKYQLLFSTKNYLHLLDRNGKYVEGFPVKLPAVATSPLTVFDYDGTKDYRLFIACADKKIYNYSVTGSKNEKFTPVITDDVVTLQLKYMKVAGSDYLVTADTEGKIYVFSRRGEGRIDFRNRMIQGCRSFFAEASGSLQNSKLIYFDDKNSLLESISLSDKKDVVKLNSDFEQALCYFDLVDDDKKTDAIIIDNDLLKCYTLDGMELFNYSGEGGFKDVSYFYDSEGAYFVINTAEEVQILDASNKKISKKFRATGLPLVSNLFNDGKKYVLVADHNVLKCVLVR